MKISNSTTKNESFAVIEKPGTSLVMLHITADLGSTHKPEDDVTRSLFCDLLLSGAGKMNRAEFLDAVNGAGGSICVRAHEGRLTITIETIESRLPKILDLTKLMLLEPTFPNKEITRAKANYLKQLKVASEQARTMALTNLVQVLYSPTERAYQYTPQQEAQVVKLATVRHFRQLHQTFLKSPWTITIGSNKATTKRIQKNLSAIHPDSIIETTNNIDNTIKTAPKFITHQISSQQNIEVAIGQRLPLTFNDADYPAVVFALAVLGRWGGFSGRLMTTVREKEGLTYGIYARSEAGEKDVYGHWRIMTFFHPKDLERGFQSVWRELNKLHRSGITTEELNRFQTILTTNYILLFDSLVSLTNTVHSYNVKNMTFAEYEDIMERMKKLSVKEVNVAIKKYLDPAKLSYSLAGNFNDLSSQLKALRSSLKL